MSMSETSNVSKTQGERAEKRGREAEHLDMQLWDLWSATAAAFPDRDALVSMWQPNDRTDEIEQPPVCTLPMTKRISYLRWSYKRLLEEAENIAKWLKDLGCLPGHKLLVVLWNSAEWAIFFWAAMRLEMIFVPLDPRSVNELPAILVHIGPQTIVAEDEAVAASVDAQNIRTKPSMIKIQCSGRTNQGWLSILSRDESEFRQALHQCEKYPDGYESRLPSKTVAMILLTSGTTGDPKICPHTHRNLVSQACEYDPKPEDPMERWLVHTPVSHIFAINNTLRAWKEGGTVVFPAKSFKVEATLRALVSEKCTIMSATPTLVKSLLSHPDFCSDQIHLDLVTIGGTMITHEDVRLCREGLGANHAIQAYGMTEGAPLISWRRHDQLLTNGYHPGVGRVLPGTVIRICRPGTEELLGIGDTGELHVSGSSVISSYLEENYDSPFYEADGLRWFCTGDQGFIDEDGIVHLLGRYKDLIIRGGENIHPSKIEEVLSEIPGIQVAVVGVSDTFAGQVPVAVVKLPVGIDKPAIARKALTLGPALALGGIFTLEELGLEAFPVTTLGKPKRRILSSLVEDFQTKLSEQVAESASQSIHESLVASLIDAWEQVTATRPHRDQDVLYLADSISMLRFCDAVIRLCGKHIYLQDLVNYNTVDKQARLLAERNATSMFVGQEPSTTVEQPLDVINDQSSPKASVPMNPEADPLFIPTQGDRQNWTKVAAQTFKKLEFDHLEVEDTIPLRSSLRRLAVGQRPQSYHVAFSFRVPKTPVWRLYRALGRLVAQHQLLRSVLCVNVEDQYFHAVPTYHDTILSHIVYDDEVDTVEEAVNYAGSLSSDDHASDFMLRVSVIRCKEDDLNYLVLILSHSIMDALAAVPWYRDLDLMLHDEEVKLSPMTSYKLFADLHCQLDSSRMAQEAVAFHVKRLRGISRLKQALWPPQRAPGWMISDDSGSAHALQRQLIRDRVWKGTWDTLGAGFGTPRISRLVNLSELPLLTKGLGITPPNFTKAAIALLTAMETNASHALFTSWESCRSWPFVPKWMEDRLPAAMSIDGPTLEWVLNMPEINLDETITAYLKRMEYEQRQISANQHAPWSAIAKDLKEEAQVAMDASFRQAFVWDVSLLGLALHKGYLTDFKVLEPVNRHNWADCGLFWNAFLIDPQNLYFIASWDTAQMNNHEVERLCDTLAEISRRLALESNGDKKIRDVFKADPI